MRTTLRKIGNSHIAIIPEVLLLACEMGDEVDICLEGKNLLITPIKLFRAGWFDGYKPEADCEQIEALFIGKEADEWVW